MKHTLLCVDDEFDNVDALERLLRKKYRVLKATSGREALDLLAGEKSVALIISDQRMPQMTGVEFLRASMKTHPFAMRILLTGYADMGSVVDAINKGEVYRYLTKPWDPVDLANTVDKAIEKFELSAELAQKNLELEKALAELQGLDHAKTQFMVLINHELKTPLTALLSFAQLVKETALDEDQHKYIDRIETSGMRLKEIVDDVMELLLAETGLLKLKMQKLDLVSLIPQMSSALEQEKDKRKLKVRFDLAKEVKVNADKTVVQNVLNRILHNAVKFAKSGSEISIGYELQGEQVFLQVENAGETLDSATIERILKPFTLDEDMMNHSRGMGLGLSLCQALLKRCGSQLHISSRNKKVTVGFALPAVRS